jgi:DNA polymerase-3 subunit gamma/tau
MCKDPSTNKLIETSDAVRARYVKQAEKSPVFFLINCLEINNKCDITYRTSNHKRLSLEISLIQMCQAGNPVPAENTAPRVQHTKTAPETSVPQSPASVNPPAVDKIQPAQSQEADQISSKSEVQQAAEPEITPSVDSEKEILVETHKPVVTQPETDPLAETEQLPKYPVSSMHSVKDILSQGAKVSTKQDENQTKIIRQDPLDSEKVVDAFNKYANSIQNDSSMLFSALTSHAPVADDNIIFITLDNTILQKELNDSWTSLLKFLTDELNNDLIEIKVEINAQPNDVKKFMTDKDKLDAMKEKNPNFAALTDQLNLELDVM